MIKRITLTICTLFIALLTPAQDIQKNKIIANAYAIMADAENDFQKYKGDFVSTDKYGTQNYKLKKKIFVTDDFFSAGIEFIKNGSSYLLTLQSDEDAGENIYRIIESALDNLVTKNILAKNEKKFPPGIQTKAYEYVDANKNPIASIWFKSSVRYMIYFNSNKSIQPQLKQYLSAAKINIANTQPITTPPKAPVKINDPISFNDYFLFYKNLVNTSDLGFDWIFNTKNPDSLEIRFVHIYPNSPITKQITFDLKYSITTIVRINGIPTAKMSRQQAIAALNGKAGSACEIDLRLHTSAADIIFPYTLVRAPFTNVAKVNYEKGMAAFKMGKIEEAIKYFSDWSYPESQLMLFKIYSGRILDEIVFGNDQQEVILKEKFRKLVNADSMLKYSANPKENPELIALVSLYCYQLIPKASNLASAKHILTKKAADNGDVRSQELMAYLHAWHFSDGDMISKDILPDKEQAMYWYKRAVAGGSKDGEKMLDAIRKMKISGDLQGLDLGRSRVFNFKDAKAMTQEAHMGIAAKTIVPDYLSPFGINGFEDGNLYRPENMKPYFYWNTHNIKDREYALKNYEDAAYVFKNEFSISDFKDIRWYDVVAEGTFIKGRSAIFTTTEKDGKLYKMKLTLILEKVAAGYQIGLQYTDEK